MNEFQKRIFVAGHRGMVGSAIVRSLTDKGYTNITCRSHSELDLTDQAQVRAFFSAEKPQEVYVAAAKLCESYNRQYGCDFRSVMPTNLYGPGDNYHPENSHVLPAMIRRFHEAKLSDAPSVVIWGTGSPKREFLYVDDMASACVHVMDL